MDYKRIGLFDLDGTLISIAPSYKLEIVKKTIQSIDANFSGEIEEFADGIWAGEINSKNIESIINVKPSIFWKTFSFYDTPERRVENITLYGDVSVLKDLRAYGYLLGIVTGTPRKIADAEIKLLNNAGIYFDSVVIARIDEGISFKPSPEGLYKCLVDLCCCQEGNIFFAGNGGEDILAAREAGIVPIFIDRLEYSLPQISLLWIFENLIELRESSLILEKDEI